MALKVMKKTVKTKRPMINNKLAGMIDQLNNIQVPDFVAATALYFVLDNRNELNIFLSFHRR